jgi:hypothetical protein
VYEGLLFSKGSFRNKISSQVISEIFCGVEIALVCHPLLSDLQVSVR